MADPRKPIFDAVRLARGKGFADSAEVALLDEALDKLGVARAAADSASPQMAQPMIEPAWLAEARKLIGTREIVGPAHNNWIVAQWAKLGASWFNDDETPWCGLFVAHCMQAANLSYPAKGAFARALAWKDWGKPCPQVLLGAVAVFQRTGGGHVGFVVGESADQLYILGGNQSNMVSIMPIAKARMAALRWPAERALGTIKAPAMAGGVVSTNEA